MAVGTPLEGKISVEKQVDEDYADRMINGGADMCFSTWGGATMDPFGIMQVYTDPELKYEYGFDTENEQLTINVGGTDVTNTWFDWNYELNDGNGDYSASKADLETRLDILSAIDLPSFKNGICFHLCIFNLLYIHIRFNLELMTMSTSSLMVAFAS